VATDEGRRDASDGREPKPTEDGGCLVAAETAEDKIVSSPPPGCVSKSSVYNAYMEMCAREGRPIMFTRAVMGKMVKRAFPYVRTKRRGPRGRVTQHYIGLRPINALNQRRSEDDVVVEEEEDAAVREPTPDTALCADYQPTPKPSHCVDTAWRQHKNCSFNCNVNTYHRAFEKQHQQAEEQDCDPGLSGSGEWHATAYLAPSVGRARHEGRRSSMGALPADITPPPQPLSSSSWSAASTGVWAPYLPSTLAAMGVPQEPQQQVPLENLESLWDWRHTSVDEWHPPLFDIMTGDSSLAARSTTPCEVDLAWAPSLHQPQQEPFSCGLFDAGAYPESFLGTMVDMLVPKGM
jgi:hypothetical protein